MSSNKYKKLIEGNSYYNGELRFHIEKPEDWVFVPQQWAQNFREKNLETNSELEEMLRKGAVTFIAFYKHHDNSRYPLPTVQCTCRLKSGLFRINLSEMAEQMTKELPQIYSEFNILEYTADYIISGYRGIIIRSSFSMNNHDGDTIECLGRMIFVDGVNFVYMIGLTGSTKGKYRCEDEFDKIIQSIKIE